VLFGYSRTELMMVARFALPSPAHRDGERDSEKRAAVRHQNRRMQSMKGVRIDTNPAPPTA
jgi:hypothetical protein